VHCRPVIRTALCTVASLRRVSVSWYRTPIVVSLIGAAVLCRSIFFRISVFGVSRTNWGYKGFRSAWVELINVGIPLYQAGDAFLRRTQLCVRGWLTGFSVNTESISRSPRKLNFYNPTLCTNTPLEPKTLYTQCVNLWLEQYTHTRWGAQFGGVRYRH